MWDTCPKCGGVAVTVCCCPLMHSECMDGHEWYYKIRTLEKVQEVSLCRKGHRRRRDDKTEQTSAV
jgi:hypothetical protein